MIDQIEEIKKVLAEAVEASPAPETLGSSRISTPQTLVKLAQRWPSTPDQEGRAALEALCRKVHVAKKVMNSYQIDWKKDPEARPLDQIHQPLLIAVLLAYSSADKQGTETERGLGLKLLNAALDALDLSARAEPSGSAPMEWRQSIETVLDQMLAEVRA